MSFADRLRGAYEAALTHTVELPTLPGMMVQVRELGPVDCLAHHGLLSAVIATMTAGPGAGQSDRAMAPDDLHLLQRAACASIVAGSEPPAEGAERTWEPLRVVTGEAGPGELPVGVLTLADLAHVWWQATGAGRRAAAALSSFRGRARGVDGGGPDGGGDGPPGPVPPLAAPLDG
jgi:hypothetical protein